jgi:hypothetical protein
MRRTHLLVLPLAITISACADEPNEPLGEACPRGFVEGAQASGASDCQLDVLAVGELVADIAQHGPYLEPINREPFVQQHGPDKLRVIYGSTNLVHIMGQTVTAAELYRTIDPDDLDGTLDFEMPMGSTFVHYTPEGPPYGVMVKLARGNAPADNDWFFSRFDEYGYPVPIESYDGQTCRDCHVLDDRPLRTDMLWGVPRTAL